MRNNSFQEAVAGYLNWPPSLNNRSMSMAAGILVMISDPTLGTALFPSRRTLIKSVVGLDENGHPKA